MYVATLLPSPTALHTAAASGMLPRTVVASGLPFHMFVKLMPNAALQARGAAAATQERRLFPVACKRWLGGVRRPPTAPPQARCACHQPGKGSYRGTATSRAPGHSHPAEPRGLAHSPASVGKRAGASRRAHRLPAATRCAYGLNTRSSIAALRSAAPLPHDLLYREADRQNLAVGVVRAGNHHTDRCSAGVMAGH